MPKKTKKQKILALYHKKMQSVKMVEPKNTPQSKAPQEKIAVPAKPEVKENSYFYKDFRKSLILVAIVIALEIALYFAKLIR